MSTPETPVAHTAAFEPNETTPDPIVGIDLGTTNSLVAYCDQAGPRVLGGPGGQPILPSVVRFDESGQVAAIGEEARDHAVEHPLSTVFSVKRLMGRGFDEVQQWREYLPYEIVPGPRETAAVQVGRAVLTPQQVSALILQRLKQVAESALGREVRRAVVTVPAYFDDAQRQATRDAGRLAGLEVLRIVNEPTAAALAYNLGRIAGKQTPQPKTQEEPGPASTVAVYDLGGGTFDVSLLRLEETEAGVVDQVLATAGDTHLGGDDVDRMLVELCQKEIQEQFGAGLSFPPATRQAFRTFAEATKVRLSNENEARLRVELPPAEDGSPRVYDRTIRRDEFEAMIDPWVQRTLDRCRRALANAGLDAQQIDRVILVGGSTRIPLVRQRVGELFGREPYTALNPDEVVALGAAVQGSILAGLNRSMLLLDVVPLSLGIETLGGGVAKLILANQAIPCSATEMFSTHVQGQTSVKIRVVQGERELVEDCRVLGEFELKGIPPMPAGLPKLEVTFLVDANGILNVSAVEKRSERRASLQVVPHFGLTPEEVERIERESFQHAKADMKAHRLIDLRNQASMDLKAIQRQLDRVGSELDSDYLAQIEEHRQKVQGFLEAADPDDEAFAEALTEMDHATVKLAEAAIAQTLRQDEGSSSSESERTP